MSTSPEKSEGAKPDKKKKVTATAKLKVNPKLSLLQDAIRLMEEAGLGALTFEQGEVKIRLSRGSAPIGVETQESSAPVSVSSPTAHAAASVPSPAAKADNGVTVNSPMVGTFYRAASPDSKPFIEEGSVIAVGQVYCIIEAMKLMNEVKAEVAGRVTKIVVQNGQAVEFNQPLIVIDPS